MGVVSVSSSASRTTTLAVGGGFSAGRSQALRRSSISFVAFKSPDRDVVKTLPKYGKQSKRAEIVTVDATAAVPSAAKEDLDYNEVAEVLENIYKLSPAQISEVEQEEQRGRRGMRRKRGERGELDGVVRNRKRKIRRLSLDLRIELRRRRWREGVADAGEDVWWKGETGREKEAAEVFKLLREYSMSTDVVSLDWKKMKIPRVLSLYEHKWLFKLMQPMKTINEMKKNLHKDLNREPLDGELAKAVKLSATKLKKYMEVGRAARNKIIKHNLRLVLYTIKKHYHDIANSPRFNDLCQAGAKGLVTAIDRFEPKHSVRLSTYALFWIRHSIVRSLTHLSFTRVSYGIEQVRQEIQKAKLELTFEHQRSPMVEEIIARVGISSERYHDVMKASTSVYSLNARHAITQEEFVDCIRDVDGADGEATPRQTTLRRLAIDDVLDSLKPKESLVIRQRYGLDGKGERTLGEIAGNLSISREMVRKHERKALMKLKHPARLDYLRPYI